MISGSRWGGRREREEDNEVEVNDITVHFKGDGRREEEGGVRRKGARRRSNMRPLRQKVRRKCDPLGRNKAESTWGGQICDPLSRKCVKNATP